MLRKQTSHHAKAASLIDDRARQYRELIRREAKIGGRIFGPVTPGTHREFFCLNRHTWIWHEEWNDAATSQLKHITTRYDVRPNGIFKTQDGQSAAYLTPEEAQNFFQAVKLYGELVNSEIYDSPAA